ncbi:MAG: ribosome-associated translation inhibitor RaiA [Candidatus Eisenbacteria bacterium]|uniref:Ribosome-associated translation inhibitor RaiA n=1 Tax=Eiseniibacteriota bacterium TaxID=2212470 RepID=A0A7Y2E692_UNCEI|nr:ribosome-associated translation inhibitor RaiA [Candidatus Eisenbacteria bacterium]
MRVEITSRHCDIPENLKERVETRVQKILRYDDRIQEARVVVNFERNRFNAEATVKSNGAFLVSHAEEDTDKNALEQVLDRLEKQVRRHHDRVVKGRKKGGSLASASIEAMPQVGEVVEEKFENVFDESDYEGLVAEDPGDFGVAMAIPEALAMLRASSRDCLGFTNADNDHKTLLYKRRDGNFGVVEVEP